MRILLVSYFYSPLETVAAERWSRYAEFLAGHGHEITVLTGPWRGATAHEKQGKIEVHYLDDPLSEDAKKLIGAGEKPARAPLGHSLFRQLAQMLFPAFLLIDGKWLWGVKAFKLLISEEMRTRDFDLVLVTGSPWSTMVATALACKFTDMRYAVDFRDLWAAEPSLKFNSNLARKYFAFLEKMIVRGAQLILTVNEPIRAYLSRLKPEIPNAAIANGYAGALSHSAQSFNSVSSAEKHILYAGSISNYHGVDAFLSYAARASTQVPFTFMGRDFVGALKGKAVRELPHRSTREADAEMAKAGVLLMTLDKKSTDYITGKLMSYIKAGRPILYWGPPQSPAAKLIRDHDLGWVVNCEDFEELKATLVHIRESFQQGKPFEFRPDFAGLKDYSIETLGAKLDACLRQVLTTNAPKK